jgi:hypothetical protein
MNFVFIILLLSIRVTIRVCPLHAVSRLATGG